MGCELGHYVGMVGGEVVGPAWVVVEVVEGKPVAEINVLALRDTSGTGVLSVDGVQLPLSVPHGPREPAVPVQGVVAGFHVAAQ